MKKYMIRTLILFVIFQVAFIKVYPQAENAAEGEQNISSGVPDNLRRMGFLRGVANEVSNGSFACGYTAIQYSLYKYYH